MEERRSDESLEPMVEESLPLLNGHDRAVKQNSSLGEDLKHARLLAGHSLEDVSKVLRIRLSYLRSLESGEFDELPGLTYAIGFLRSYSSYLDLDSEAMVARLKQGSDGAIAKPDLSFHVPNREISRPRPILIFIVLVFVGIAYGGWHLYSTQGQIANELVTDVSTTLTEVAGFSNDDEVMVAIASGSDNPVEVSPEEKIKSLEISRDPLSDDEGAVITEYEESKNLKATDSDKELIVNSNLNRNNMGSDPAPDAESAQTSIESSSAAVVNTSSLKSIPLDTQSVNSNNSNSVPDTVGTKFSEKATEVIGHEEPKVYGAENTNTRVIITATEDSWVQIQGPKNELIFTRILRDGDIFQVPNRDGLKMVTGNAGALEIRVDGNLLDSIGPIGVVRRDLSLNPEQLLAANGIED